MKHKRRIPNQIDTRLITLYTDGSFSPVTGCSGWSCIFVDQGETSVIYGGYVEGYTNNVMEILSVIRGLESIDEPTAVRVVSDSMYVVNAIRNNWIKNWKRNNWITRKGTPVANRDCWEVLAKLLDKHIVTICHQKAHGHKLTTIDAKGNDMADHFANVGRAIAEEQLGV